MFFLFFALGAMGGAGVQSWLVTVLKATHGLSLQIASVALTAYMLGSTSGVLVGGWFADSHKEHVGPFAVVLTALSAALILVVNWLGLPGLADKYTSAFGGDNGLTVNPPVPPSSLGSSFPLLGLLELVAEDRVFDLQGLDRLFRVFVAQFVHRGADLGVVDLGAQRFLDRFLGLRFALFGEPGQPVQRHGQHRDLLPGNVV